MKNLLLLVFVGAALASVKPEVKPLTVNAEGFVQSFNQSADSPRVVGVFSPTCGHCLQACSDFEEILQKYPDSDLKAFILWAPFSDGDNIGEVLRGASVYLSDRRVSHFWDVWRFGSRSYSEPLRIPLGDTWGLFLFYAPGTIWEEAAPKPDFWMQSRGLRVGTPFSRKGFESKLKRWIQ